MNQFYGIYVTTGKQGEGKMIDVSCRASCEDFEVEFSSGTVREDAGITEENISEREAILAQYSRECEQELEKLTCQADSIDLLASVSCGIIAGIIDAIAVGKWDFAKAKAICNEDINRTVIDFAKKNPKYKSFLGRGRDGDRLDTAIQFLEKEYHLPGDGVYQNKAFNMGIGGKDHRLEDFCHHLSPVGLVCCVLVQFSEETVFFNSAGELFRVPIVVNEYGQLIGDTPRAKVFSGVVNWFFNVARTLANRKGHIMSDKATSQGIPGTFMSIMKEVSALPCFKDKDFGEKLRKAYANGIGNGKKQLNLGPFNALFSGAESKVDFRTEMAVGRELKRQSIPVLVNEMLVRGVFFVRRFVDELKEKGSFDKINWKACIPANNRTIQRMVTVASGTFLAVDLTDALVESAITSGGNSAKFAEGIVLRINFVNIGRFTLGCAVDITSGVRKTGYEFMTVELSTGRLAVTAENIFVRARKRLERSKEREAKLAVVFGEDLSIDETSFSIEDAQLAAKELAEKKIRSYEDLKNRPWYKKLCSAITFHNEEKRLVLEDIKGTQEILALFMKVYDADMAQLHARVDRLENVVAQQIQQPAQPARVVEYVPEKEEKPDAKPNKPRTIRPDINAKYGGKYKIISAKEPDKALSVFYDRSFMGGLNSMNRTLELVSKNNLHVATWTVESCGPNIYRLVETSSGLVIEFDPASGNTTTLFVKKWREKPSCIWEIRENRDKTVSFLSNADVEKGLKCGRGNRVGVGKTGLKDSRWILERV